MKHKSTMSFKRASFIDSRDFECLNGNDVVTKKVSDHHPVIHDGVFFWNIMMKCKKRGGGFNNGFGLIETNDDYIARLELVGRVIVEAVYRDSSIEHICLCEGPIELEHIKILYHSLMRSPIMHRFRIENMFNKPEEEGVNWGLLMLSNTRYIVTKVHTNVVEKFPKLMNRFQLWKLEEHGKEKYIALAHFPFAGDEYKTEQNTLSRDGLKYCRLIKELLDTYSNDSLFFCADFNFNPNLISLRNDRALDKISHNNSILLEHVGDLSHDVKMVTVDGILLSITEKQIYHASQPKLGLLRLLKSEYSFFKSSIQFQKDLNQKEHDMQFGLVPYRSVKLI